MKLIVCWNTSRGPFGHPCGNAHQALREAGHDPEVVKARGWKLMPDALNRSEGRREARRLTGSVDVPVLVTGDEEVVAGWRNIEAWAREHPAA